MYSSAKILRSKQKFTPSSNSNSSMPSHGRIQDSSNIDDRAFYRKYLTVFKHWLFPQKSSVIDTPLPVTKIGQIKVLIIFCDMSFGIGSENMDIFTSCKI